MTSQIDANNNTTTFVYNNLNQLVKVTDPNGYITTFTYDKNGNRTSMTDANGKTTTYAYNYKGDLVQATDALGGITSLAYGSTGCTSCGGGVDKLTTVTDAKGNTTTYAYDLLGRLITETDPLGNVTSYTYDAKGNLLSRTDANNKTIIYTYDSINRLLTKTYPDTTTATFTYDANGNILTAANANITYTSTYDADGRVTSVTDSNNKTVSYQYNTVGNRTQLTYPDSSTLTYTYDTTNRLSTIIDGTKTYTYSYDSLDRRTKLVYPNNANNTNSYDKDSRLTNLTNKLGSYTYQYDKVINRTTTTDPNGTHNYTYDKVYELLTATHTAKPTEQFTYDLTGNRTNTTVNSDNSLLSDGTYTYTYDNNGNQITRTTISTGEVRTYTWDSENRLISVTGSGLAAQYKYDPFGRRIQKNVNNAITNYVYDGPKIIAEYDQNNQLITRYVQGPGIDEHLGMQRNGQAKYYHTDGLGSVTALTDDAGTIVQSYGYDSFGNINAPPTSTVASQVGYYSINDGTHFTRSSTPTSTPVGSGTVSQTANTDGSVTLTISNAPGYADDGFYLRVGTLGDFNGLQIKTSPGSDPVSVNIWFDKDNNGEFFVWNGNVLTSLGNDAYILGPSSVQTVLNVNANSYFTSLIPGGGNYTLAQLKNGAVAGITSATKIAIWVGIDTNGGSLSATINSLQIPGFTQPYTYTGREYDPETGLSYYRARYYDTIIGRFISSDPIGLAGGINLYAYVGNNPVMFIDPWGLFTATVYDSGGRNGKTYGGTLVVIGDNGQVVSVNASSWPNPTNPSPGIASTQFNPNAIGGYPATYSPTGLHSSEPAIVLPGYIPTNGPNPKQNGFPLADLIRIHCGDKPTNRGSSGCITIQPDQCQKLWNILRKGETGTVNVIRY